MFPVGTHRHYVPVGTYRHNVPVGTFVLSVPAGTLGSFPRGLGSRIGSFPCCLPLWRCIWFIGAGCSGLPLAKLACPFHLLTFWIPEGRLGVSEIGTVGWGWDGPKTGVGGWSGWFLAGRRRSGGLGVLGGLGGWRLLGGCRPGALRLGGLLRRRWMGGEFRRGRFV